MIVPTMPKTMPTLCIAALFPIRVAAPQTIEAATPIATGRIAYASR